MLFTLAIPPPPTISATAPRPRKGAVRLGGCDHAVATSCAGKALLSGPQALLSVRRSTAASLGVSAGGSIKAVQRMLGHASAKMTLDTYAGLFEDDLEILADRLNDRILRADVALELPELVS
jgi:hypothetical protein